MAKTHRSALELTETGTISGLYLSSTNATAPSTIGQLTYVASIGLQVKDAGGVTTIGTPNITRIATDAGDGTGTIATGTRYVTVTSAGANKIIILPAPVVGHSLKIQVGTNGCELRSSTPADIAINGGKASNGESAIAANTLLDAVCTSATTWVITQLSSTGLASAVEPAS